MFAAQSCIASPLGTSLYDGFAPQAPYRYVEPPVVVAPDVCPHRGVPLSVATGGGLDGLAMQDLSAREVALLAPLVARRPGLRAPGGWDGFELGVRAILGQQISVAAASPLRPVRSTLVAPMLPEPMERRSAVPATALSFVSFT